MKLPLLFRRDRPTIPSANAQDHAERVIAESLRVLGQVCTKVADAIEAQRLERNGYAHNSYLRRMDQADKADDTSKSGPSGTGGG
ncbi:hypothetical protein D7Y13_18940 [Corallococcus praedator]|uniref:Uncharacterized protein n=2 Tax=Corallococcus TaxID=83461 RepID=A0ABX9QG46_9BACT|nr:MULTISPECIES: hypothetical protein [Corallococcus]RKH12418.1 hypothetical protein D7X74_23605 [Corallococcus sp. CA047B]RKH30988.1 hypothetical protein D7X75_20300 [Corallococcus sp. CA031C]RKI07004.1 hypothetical protein D7Y13_18940 [Corallococcus praedator]